MFHFRGSNPLLATSYIEPTRHDIVGHLAQRQVSMLTMLRAGRCLAFCFDRAANLGSGRETLWISPSTELRFFFHGSRPARINHVWLRSIMATADTATGLRLVKEPAEAQATSSYVGVER